MFVAMAGAMLIAMVDRILITMVGTIASILANAMVNAMVCVHLWRGPSISGVGGLGFQAAICATHVSCNLSIFEMVGFAIPSGHVLNKFLKKLSHL